MEIVLFTLTDVVLCDKLYLVRSGKIKINSDSIRGYTETIILTQLFEEDSYGYAINKNIHKITNGDYELKEGTLYSAFRRLEDMDYITSYWGNVQLGARRKYYKITQKGKDELVKSIKNWEHTKKIIDKLIMEGK